MFVAQANLMPSPRRERANTPPRGARASRSAPGHRGLVGVTVREYREIEAGTRSPFRRDNVPGIGP